MFLKLFIFILNLPRKLSVMTFDASLRPTYFCTLSNLSVYGPLLNMGHNYLQIVRNYLQSVHLPFKTERLSHDVIKPVLAFVFVACTFHMKWNNHISMLGVDFDWTIVPLVWRNLIISHMFG